MIFVKPIYDQVELDAKRDMLLKKYGDKMSAVQRDTLNGSNGAVLRAPAKLAYNPAAQILLWGDTLVGPQEMDLDEDEQVSLYFLSGED